MLPIFWAGATWKDPTRIELFMRESIGSNSFYRRLTLGFLMFLSLWLLTAVLMPAQTAQSPPGAAPINMQPIRSAVDTLQQAVYSVNVSHWKAPSEIKGVAQDDLGSITNDLSSVLPGLLQTAQASPTAFKPAFEVYRNVNALYDVVLRVTQIASLTGASNDANYLQNALGNLAKARNGLSDSLATASDQRDTELNQLRAKVQGQTSGANGQTSPKRIVVNDGPDGTSSKKNRSSKTPSNPQ